MKTRTNKAHGERELVKGKLLTQVEKSRCCSESAHADAVFWSWQRSRGAEKRRRRVRKSGFLHRSSTGFAAKRAAKSGKGRQTAQKRDLGRFGASFELKSGVFVPQVSSFARRTGVFGRFGRFLPPFFSQRSIV